LDALSPDSAIITGYDNSDGMVRGTVNGGASWKDLRSCYCDFYCISAVNQSTIVAGTVDYLVWYTNNSGNSWSYVSVSSILYDMTFINDNTGWAVGEKIISTTDGGQTWST